MLYTTDSTIPMTGSVGDGLERNACCIKNVESRLENEDGGVGRHTAPPRTTRTDRKSNGKEVGQQGDKKETYIQTGRRGGDGHRGGEDLNGPGGTETGGVWVERGRQSDH